MSAKNAKNVKSAVVNVGSAKINLDSLDHRDQIEQTAILTALNHLIVRAGMTPQTEWKDQFSYFDLLAELSTILGPQFAQKSGTVYSLAELMDALDDDGRAELEKQLRRTRIPGAMRYVLLYGCRFDGAKVNAIVDGANFSGEISGKDIIHASGSNTVSAKMFASLIAHAKVKTFPGLTPATFAGANVGKRGKRAVKIDNAITSVFG